MRRISRLLAAVALTIATAGVVSAQAGATPPRPGANIVSRVVRASLNGIVLTDAEKMNLATVSKAYAPKFKTLADQRQPFATALRTARLAHDNVAARAARVKLVALRRSGVTTLREALLDIRAVLTPEHQSHFDANAVRVRRAIRGYFQRPLPG
jgi:hypothetical protein